MYPFRDFYCLESLTIHFCYCIVIAVTVLHNGLELSKIVQILDFYKTKTLKKFPPLHYTISNFFSEHLKINWNLIVCVKNFPYQAIPLFFLEIF